MSHLVISLECDRQTDLRLTVSWDLVCGWGGAPGVCHFPAMWIKVHRQKCMQVLSEQQQKWGLLLHLFGKIIHIKY